MGDRDWVGARTIIPNSVLAALGVPMPATWKAQVPRAQRPADGIDQTVDSCPCEHMRAPRNASYPWGIGLDMYCTVNDCANDVLYCTVTVTVYVDFHVLLIRSGT